MFPWMRMDWRRSLPLSLTSSMKSVRRHSTICFWVSQAKRNDSLFDRVCVAKPRHHVPTFTRAPAEMVHGHPAAGVRTADHAPGLWGRAWTANRHAQLAGIVAGLPALPRAGHSGLHGIYVVLLSVSLRGLHTNALPEIVGRSIDHSGKARTRGLGRSAVGGDTGNGLRGGCMHCARRVRHCEGVDAALGL